MNGETANLANAALHKRLRARWRNQDDARVELTANGVAIYWRQEHLGVWTAADRTFSFYPVGQSAPRMVAHTILGAVAFTEGLVESTTAGKR